MTTSTVSTVGGVEALFALMREKTIDGKLDWKRSASPNEYFAAVGGKQVYILRKIPDDNGMVLQQLIQLVVRDPDRDEVLYELERPATLEPLKLFQEVRQRADRVNERVNESVQLLNSL